MRLVRRGRGRRGAVGLGIVVSALLTLGGPDAVAPAATPPAVGGCAAITSPGTPAADHGRGDGHQGHASGGESEEQSPYAERYDPDAPIRALTPEEITQIERGEGTGLALPAELNGVPGPRHVLDLAAELGLSADQTRRVQAVYEAMRAAAIAAGSGFLAAEQALEEDFRCGTLTESELPARVAEVYRLRGELAAVHLAAHLQTADVLTPGQIATYNRIRGYR